MPLTDVAARSAKPREKAYKLVMAKACTSKSCPTVQNTGASNTGIDGKERRAALGVYPAVSLLAARKAREEIKEALGPDLTRRMRRNVQRLSGVWSVKTRSRQSRVTGMNTRREAGAEPTTVRVMKRMENELFPSLGARPIQQITAPEILAVIRTIEKRDALGPFPPGVANRR